MKLQLLLLIGILFGGLSTAIAQTPGGTAMNIDYIQFTQDNLLKYVDCGNDASLNVGNEMTVEMWFKVENNTWNQKMIGKLNPSFNSGFMMAVDQGNIYPEIWTPNLNQMQAGGLPAAPTPFWWIHFAVTFEAGGDMSAYINGELVFTQAAGALPIVSNTDPLIIGIAPWDLSNFQFFGSMDEIRLWNVSHSQAEIQNYLHRELAGNEGGLVAYYNCNAGSGTTLADNSSNSNDGNMVNMGAANWVTSNAVVGDATSATMAEVKGLWNALGQTDPRFVTTTNGLSLLASNIPADDYTVFGHTGASGTGTADNPTNAAANFEHASRVYYLNEVGAMTGDFIFDLDNAAGGGATISNSQLAVNYTLLYRSGATGPYTALYGGNSKTGNVISFNNIAMETGYYTIGVGDGMTAGPNAVKELDFSEMISVYPNPSAGLFNIKMQNEISRNATVQVLDALGGLTFERKVGTLDASSSLEIDLSNMAEGVYFVLIKDEQNIFTQKIVIHK
jgi:hypothetical protein